jgi:hypothetical protein
MGCKVIGLTDRRSVEVVNSLRAGQFAGAAAKGRVPVVVITGTYKLWPNTKYEMYRSRILDDRRNSVVRGREVRWFLTEDGLFESQVFAERYELYFTSEGIPVSSLREVLREAGRAAKDIPKTIRALQLEVKLIKYLSSPPTDRPTVQDVATSLGVSPHEAMRLLERYLASVVDVTDTELRALLGLRRPGATDDRLEERIAACFRRLDALEELEGDMLELRTENELAPVRQVWQVVRELVDTRARGASEDTSGEDVSPARANQATSTASRRLGRATQD